MAWSLRCSCLFHKRPHRRHPIRRCPCPLGMYQTRLGFHRCRRLNQRCYRYRPRLCPTTRRNPKVRGRQCQRTRHRRRLCRRCSRYCHRQCLLSQWRLEGMHRMCQRHRRCHRPHPPQGSWCNRLVECPAFRHRLCPRWRRHRRRKHRCCLRILFRRIQ